MPPLTKTLTTDLPGRAALLDACTREFGRTTPSASPQRSKFTVQLWSLRYCTAARHGCCTTSRSGCWRDFINAACVPSWGSSGRSTSPTRKSSSEPASQVLSVHYYSSSSAGLAMWPEWKTQECPKLSSSASCGKANAHVELQRSDTKTSKRSSCLSLKYHYIYGNRRRIAAKNGARSWAVQAVGSNAAEEMQQKERERNVKSE